LRAGSWLAKLNGKSQIEQWGSGVRRIFQDAEDQGLPSPEIIELGLRLRFIIPLAEPVSVEKSAVPLQPGLESGLELGLESKVSQNVLRILADRSLQRIDIAQSLGQKRVSGSVNRAIKELLAKQLIEYTIPDKPNSRLQKYRLTTKGKAMLANKST
jgi:ATP-dependent DNA helicase RecG